METRKDVQLNLIKDYAETLLALLLLDYHDKNYLADGKQPAKLNETMRELVNCILDVANHPNE